MSAEILGKAPWLIALEEAVLAERKRCAELAMKYHAAERPHDARNARLFLELASAIEHPKEKQHLKEKP